MYEVETPLGGRCRSWSALFDTEREAAEFVKAVSTALPGRKWSGPRRVSVKRAHLDFHQKSELSAEVSARAAEAVAVLGKN